MPVRVAGQQAKDLPAQKRASVGYRIGRAGLEDAMDLDEPWAALTLVLAGKRQPERLAEVLLVDSSGVSGIVDRAIVAPHDAERA